MNQCYIFYSHNILNIFYILLIGIEAYCILKCENQEIRTPTTKKSGKPEWKDRITFYRKKPTEDIIIEVSKLEFLYYSIFV